ncbi:MAG TPA: SDR family NAD(P)-dependent oxidoreductase [Solirubrobacteraceae bacterium]
MDLTGTTALVTGASRGIGRALVERLAGAPLKLILAGTRTPESFEPLTAGDEAGRDADAEMAPQGAAAKARLPEIRPVHMDLSSRETIEHCCEELGAQLQRVDLLINNAGLMTGGLLEQQNIDAIYAMFQVNLVAVAHLTRNVLPGMLERRAGMVVNNASISGYAHFPAATTYAASKAGVVAFTESLRRELRGSGVRAMHAITPGVETEMLARTQEVYGRHIDTSRWDRVPAPAWAAKVVAAIEANKRVLEPGGRSELARIAAAGPAFLLDAIAARAFSRRPRA